MTSASELRKLWPWRWWMTIGIGVIGTESKKLPDTLVLLADTKGSFGGQYSMNRLHKMFYNKDLKICAIASDQIDKSAEMFALMTMMLKDWWTKEYYGNLLDAITSASEMHRRARFRAEVLPRYAYLPDTLPENFSEENMNPKLLRRWQKFYVGCEMIVGAFDKDKQAYLFYLDGRGGVHNNSTPGFCAIGSGAGNAMFWLSYRNHNKSFSVKRTAYHAFEAKVMAESSPFVNEKLDLLIASYDKWSFATDARPVPLTPQDAPVTLSELREMFEKYGPQSTEEI